ncbi:hypothetical protein O9992_27700 [Vibrio lentus]|nr:hypothetical protein [Vibrio lentus]
MPVRIWSSNTGGEGQTSGFSLQCTWLELRTIQFSSYVVYGAEFDSRAPNGKQLPNWCGSTMCYKRLSAVKCSILKLI